MLFVLLLLVCSAVFLEGTVTTLPLVFVLLLLMTIWQRSSIVFIFAFFAGVVLDMLQLQIPGETSLFLLVFLFFVLLYERKYEIDSLPFVAIAAFVGSLLFCGIFGYSSMWAQAVIIMGLAIGGFLLGKLLRNQKRVEGFL